MNKINKFIIYIYYLPLLITVIAARIIIIINLFWILFKLFNKK